MIDNQTKSYLMSKSDAKPGKVISPAKTESGRLQAIQKARKFSKIAQTVTRQSKGEWLNQRNMLIGFVPFVDYSVFILH